MVNMVPHEAFACSCAEGDVVLRQSEKTRLRQLTSSPGVPSVGPSTPLECSNCKHLRGKIIGLKATMNMHMHPEQHTVNSAALLHEVLNEMEKLDFE
nr:hypothetical protein [Tanacetum cinerariifolium]